APRLLVQAPEQDEAFEIVGVLLLEDLDELADPALGAVHLDHRVEHVAPEPRLAAGHDERPLQHVERLARLPLTSERLTEVAQRRAERTVVPGESLDDLAVFRLGALEL